MNNIYDYWDSNDFDYTQEPQEVLSCSGPRVGAGIGSTLFTVNDDSPFVPPVGGGVFDASFDASFG